MKKKHRQAAEGRSEVSEASATEPITSLGKKVIGVGVALLILGFIVLSRADSMGRNWAALISPFLILGGYAVIGIGIFLPNNPLAAVSQQSSSTSTPSLNS